MNFQDDFIEWCNTVNDLRNRPFRDLLRAAKNEARGYAAGIFVASCERFFKANGHLTEKQIIALERIRDRYYHSCTCLEHYWDEFHEQEDGLCESDLAGGDF